MAQQPEKDGARSAPCYIARSKICVNGAGQSIGDGLFAQGGFKGGDFVASATRPLLASLESERLKDTCANCFVWTEGSSIGSRLYVKEGTTVQTCAGCKRFRYCSKACQKEAWNRGHKYECKNLRSLSDKEIPKAVLGCMELLVRRKYNLIPDQQWELLCRLDTHIDDFMANGKFGGIELMAMGASQFSLTQDTFTKEFVAAMYARILSNSLTLITPTFDPLGIMIDPMFSHINHSCDPNSYIIMDGAIIELRALKDIAKDEEIYISYIESTNPFFRRQSELSERWFFTCKCKKCQKGPTQQADNWSEDPKNLGREQKKVADRLIERVGSSDDPTNFVGDTLDERRAAAIQAEAFRLYEEAQGESDPSGAIKTIERAMTLCWRSGLWPVYRQPLAALRDELIVNLLAVRDYESAWMQCAKRHRYIIPKLYPQPYHPIRVVQTWQMAMLAQYLASTGKEIAPGVDMAVVAAALIGLVSNMSEKSHGVNSAFYKSVRQKWTEVDTELLSKFGSKETLHSAINRQEKLLYEMGDRVEH